MARTAFPQKILTAKAATGIGTPMKVSSWRHVVLQLSATVNTTATVKIQASASEALPNFAAAQSPTNHWDYIAVYDLQDASLIAGDTGIALNNDTAANNTRQYLVNSDVMQWINVEVTAYTDGAVTAVGVATDNN